MDPAEGIERPAKPLKPRKRFIGTSAKASSSKTPVRRVANQVPDDILNDPQLNEAIKGLSPYLFYLNMECILTSHRSTI